MDNEKLLLQLRSINGQIGIYPAAIQGCDEEKNYEQRDGYKNGWNECVLSYGNKIASAIYAAETPWTTPERLFACDNGCFRFNQKRGWCVWLSDTWYYACADWESISPEEYEKVVECYKEYGRAGVYYWVYLKRGHLPEIPDTKVLVEGIIELEKKVETLKGREV